jgi:hypothetical protein
VAPAVADFRGRPGYSRCFAASAAGLATCECSKARLWLWTGVNSAPGSRRSLNQVAAGVGMRLLEDFIGARISASTWIRLVFDASGLPSLKRREC